MAFYATAGYKFTLPPGATPVGSVVLSGALPMHQLQRRQPKSPKKPPKVPKPPKYPHMVRMLLDPQLYLAGLDVNQSPKQCAKLSTYPWFGVPAAQVYDSGEQTQKKWMDEAVATIRGRWPGKPPTDPAVIKLGAEECVDLQLALGCEAIILASPLTHDASTSYDEELAWLDAGLAHARAHTDRPVFATVAITDVCLRFTDPENNQLLDLISDAVSARGVDGVYFVVEQASEAADTRQCGNVRTLASVLHVVHEFAKECELTVVTNFLGMFGVACVAAGASVWSCGWYKSLHRLRLADQGAPGRAYPTYWSTPAAIDIHLDTDFDKLVGAGMLPAIADRTAAAAGLLAAAARGVSSKNVAEWAYQQSNVTACTEHFFQASIAFDGQLQAMANPQQVVAVEKWLAAAAAQVPKVLATLGSGSGTRTSHVTAWLDAFRHYRRVHNV